MRGKRRCGRRGLIGRASEVSDPSAEIAQPKTMVFNWYGCSSQAVKPGDYMRSPTGKVTLVLEARKVNVKVSRGERLRQSLLLLPWTDELPPGALVYDFIREPRRR